MVKSPDPVLVLSPESPFPLSGGGSLRTASLLEYLGRRYAVDLIVFREPGAPDPTSTLPRGLVRDASVLALPYHARHGLARGVRNARRFLRGSPPLIDRFAGFGDSISGFLRGRRYELAVVEHVWCAPYLEQVAPHAAKTVLDLHNVESVLCRRCACVEAWPASVAWRRFHRAYLEIERRWCPRFSLLLAASPQDARTIGAIAPGCRCEVYPNTVPPVPEPAQPEENVLIFSGNLEYHPNISAVRFFRSRVWPLLRDRFPDLRWRLIGKNPAGVANYVRGDPRIELYGPVKDAVEALARARVVIVPLLAGSGTRLKILEAWAAARAVVSTTLGAEGLDAANGRDLLLADGADEFARAVSSLLENADLRRCLGRSGHALFESRFTWESAWAHLARLGI